MIIGKIYTSRKYETWPSWFVVFEWEDVLAKANSVPLHIGGGIRRNFNRILSGLVKLFPGLKYKLVYKPNNKKPYELLFVMNSKALWRYPMHNTLPIILDSPMDSAQYVLSCTENLPVFWVTNYEFWKELKRLDSETKAC